MRKAILSCIIPVLILCISVGIVFIPYRDTVYSNAVDREIERLVSEMETGLYKQELVLIKVEDYCQLIAKEAENYDFYTDEEGLSDCLKVIVQNNNCETAIFCNSEGIGINERKKGLNIAETEYFISASEELRSNESKYFILQGNGYNGDAVACAYQVAYSGGTKGFLIAIIKTKEFSTSAFSEKLTVDYSAYVSGSGEVLADTGTPPKVSEKEDYSFWDVMPNGFKIEALERALVQKTKYINHIEDYGYIVAVPAPVSSGTAVAYISDQRMNQTVNMNVWAYDKKILAYVILIIVLLCVLLLLNRSRDNKKPNDIIDEKDPLTGLLTKTTMLCNVKKYMKASPENCGILFIMQVDGVERLREEKGKEYVEAAEIEFSKALSERYRSTDIIGRIENDKFAVFIKNVSEEKYIRKQIDDVLMFVHDFKQHAPGSEKDGAFISVGGAIYPKDAGDCDNLFDCAESALQDARNRGEGLIAMYK